MGPHGTYSHYPEHACMHNQRWHSDVQHQNPFNDDLCNFRVCVVQFACFDNVGFTWIWAISCTFWRLQNLPAGGFFTCRTCGQHSPEGQQCWLGVYKTSRIWRILFHPQTKQMWWPTCDPVQTSINEASFNFHAVSVTNLCWVESICARQKAYCKTMIRIKILLKGAMSGCCVFWITHQYFRHMWFDITMITVG